MRPALLHVYRDTQSLVGFLLIPKWMISNGYFALNSVFAPVCLTSETATFENNCVKTNKDRPLLSARKIFSRKSSFWQYKVCADIRHGSLERGCQMNTCVRSGLFSISVWVFSVSRRVATIIRWRRDRDSALCGTCYHSVVSLSVTLMHGRRCH